MTDLVYSSLIDGDEKAGWSKMTVDWLTKNKKKAYASIKGVARCYGKILDVVDVEDIYILVLRYSYSHDDYRVDIAWSDETKTALPLEGYIHSCIKYCTMQYVTKEIKHECNRVSEVLNDAEGKEMNIFDTIEDTRVNISASIENNLYDICKNCECNRYAYGADMFLVWFVRLDTMLLEKADVFNGVLDALGVSKRDLDTMNSKSFRDTDMLYIAKAVSVIGAEKALNIVREFVYAADRVDAVVRMFVENN